MAGEIIIRKAKKDFVCSCCGHVIRQGEEYLDKVILNTGKIVKHDRYHDECPASTDVEKLIRKIEAAEGDLIAIDNQGDKWHIVGVQYVAGVPMVVINTWLNNHVNTITFDLLKTFLDENGDSFV